jgi:hypothetical protein
VAAVSERRRAAGFGVALLGAVAAPLLQHRRAVPRDGFPLSHYPMFCADRGDRLTLTHLVGGRADGTERALPCGLVASGGMNQVRKQLTRSARRGRGPQVVRRVARRIADRPPYADVVAVRLVTGTYRLSGWFAGDRAPLALEVHAVAPVLRKASSVAPGAIARADERPRWQADVAG